MGKVIMHTHNSKETCSVNCPGNAHGGGYPDLTPTLGQIAIVMKAWREQGVTLEAIEWVAREQIWYEENDERERHKVQARYVFSEHKRQIEEAHPHTMIGGSRFDGEEEKPE